MPAPRECRSCASPLSPDVRWCTRCYAPVTEFAARPFLSTGFVDVPRHDSTYSRWLKTDTSFGPRGRVVATALVIAFGPWTIYGGFQIANPFFLWYLLAFIPIAVMVLKHIWVRVQVTDEEGAPLVGTPPVAERQWGWLSHRIAIPRWIALSLLGLVLLGVVGAIWFQGSGEARYAVVVLGAMTGVGMFLAWLSDS